MPLRRAASRRRGVGLIEALIALGVVSLAALLTARLQTHLRVEADAAQQRAEAAQWAHAEIEASRATGQGDAAPKDVASESGNGTSFRITQKTATPPGLGAHRVEVDIDWVDRRGLDQHLALGSIVAAAEPAHSGALALARGGATVGPVGRSTRIPVRAVDLGDGRSAYKPLEKGRIAIVLDNLDGSVQAHCGWVDPGLATRDLDADRLGPCVSMGGRLLSGVVRFFGAMPPTPTRAFDTPLPFEVQLRLGRGNYQAPPECATEAVVTTGPDRHAAYHCIVFPRADGRWSGRLDLVARGWVIGRVPGTRRVCRYVIDLDGDGRVEANLEHPANYVDVAQSLHHQNFLVTPAEESCPSALPAKPSADNREPLPLSATEPHQP